jgi:hypothetical protein
VFRVSEAEFDAIFDRIRAEGITMDLGHSRGTMDRSTIAEADEASTFAI